MKPLEYRFSLDMDDEAAQVFCNVRNGDTCSKLIANLRENGHSYEIENGIKAVFSAKKPNGDTIFDEMSCSIENNSIIYPFGEQTANVTGIVDCQFILIDIADTGDRIATPIFHLDVTDNANINEEDIVTSESTTILTDTIALAASAMQRLTGAYYVPSNGWEPDYTSTAFKNIAIGQMFFKTFANIPGAIYSSTLYIKTSQNGAEKVNAGVFFNKARKCFVDVETPHTGNINMRDAIDPLTFYDVRSDYGGGAHLFRGYMIYVPPFTSHHNSIESQIWVNTNGKILMRSRSWSQDDSNEWGDWKEFICGSVKKANLDNDVQIAGKKLNEGITAAELLTALSVYTKSEVNSLIAAISTLSFEIVQTKPVTDIKTNVIYLIPSSDSSTGNIYEEWIYVNNAWELIGSTEIDLSNYYTKNEIDSMIPTVPTNISAFTNDSGYLTLDTLPIYDGTVI